MLLNLPPYGRAPALHRNPTDRTPRLTEVQTGHTDTSMLRHRRTPERGVCGFKARAARLGLWFWVATVPTLTFLDAHWVFGQEPGASPMLERSSASDTELPRPFGVGLNVYYQDQDYAVESLALSIELPNVPPPSDVAVGNEIIEANLRLDVWLLPMVNIFGLVGVIDGRTDVQAPSPDGGSEPPFMLEIDYDGLVYGGGIVVAYGVGQFFGAVNTTFTGTNLSTTGSTVKAWVVMPRVGTVFSGVGVWAGAMYQNADERHRGEISIPLIGDVGYDVELEQKDPWNFMAGFFTGFRRHWELEASVGLGPRMNASMFLAFRP